MSSKAISLIAFASVFGGALIGILHRAVLPTHHLNAHSKDIVKLGTASDGYNFSDTSLAPPLT
jgi:hypothetical protein